VSVLPVVPARKYCAVYYLAHDSYYGMEEVVGSIPTSSTNKPVRCARLCPLCRRCGDKSDGQCRHRKQCKSSLHSFPPVLVLVQRHLFRFTVAILGIQVDPCLLPSTSNHPIASAALRVIQTRLST